MMARIHFSTLDDCAPFERLWQRSKVSLAYSILPPGTMPAVSRVDRPSEVLRAKRCVLSRQGYPGSAAACDPGAICRNEAGTEVAVNL